MRQRFNPLVIGSSVLIVVYPTGREAHPRFNPLVIGSSVLIAKPSPVRPSEYRFQSPSNRVKCSDPIPKTQSWSSPYKFQSPSNRVKCSDRVKLISRLRPLWGFNPLVIGSSVLIWMVLPAGVAASCFNPLVIGSSVLIRPCPAKLWDWLTSFNPLVIGSSVLIRSSAITSASSLRCFNPLVIGSSVLMCNRQRGIAQREGVSIP